MTRPERRGLGGAPAVADLSRRVAAFGLVGAPACPTTPLDDRLWHAALSRLRQERLLGMAVQAIADGALPVTPAQRDLLSAEHASAMCLVLLLERELVRVADQLAAEEVDYRVLKGPAVARTAYPDPSWRTFTDIDILVAGDRFDRTVDLLAALGYRRRSPEVRPGYDRRFGKGATLVGPTGFELDLHRTFVPGRYGLRMRADDLLCDASTIVLGGTPVKTLTADGRFMNACYHAALGGPRPTLAMLRDVAQMLASSDFDAPAIRRLALAWAAEAVVARAVADAVEQLGLRTDLGSGHARSLAGWACNFRPRRVDRRAVRSYTTHRSFSRQAIGGLSSVPGLRPKLAFLTAVAGARRRPADR